MCIRDRVVRGTRTRLSQATPWPAELAGRRLCKFAAMLIPNPVFDPIRRSFVLPLASQRRQVASILNDRDSELLMPVVAFLTDDERADVAVDDPATEPLLHQLWEPYLRTVETERGYWPTTIEVMAIAVAFRANISIVEVSARGAEAVSYTHLTLPTIYSV